jgi:hypothetical protein
MARVAMRTGLGLWVVAVAGLAGATAMAARPKRDGIPSYAQWKADVGRVMEPAIPWLQTRLTRGGARLAVVLDVDNTALETSYHPSQPNRPVRALAEWAHRHHVAVLFATARGARGYDSTLRQLRAAGYPVDALCTRQPGDAGAAATKQRCRRQYTDAGYTITENIGNRPADLEGGNYEKGFLLPDYHNTLP